MKRILGLLFTFSFLFFSCKKSSNALFQKVSYSHSKIDFKNDLNPTPELNILTYLYYYNGAGVAAADFNNDSFIDLFFTSNEGEDKLYINQGNLKFIDVTKTAKIKNFNSWSTGVTYTDINQDGLVDIYICKASNYRSLSGQNLLYVNQGIDDNGIPTFKEDAASFGLDFSGLSTQAAFFDYDLDGDLDLFLMNHSVHPNRAYGKGSQREKLDARSGDRLYQNNNGLFVDVSANAGIFQGKVGYGLGLAISDINSDGYPDIYVGNDFYENDYLYINNQDGTFEEIISKDENSIAHTSHFSMGNDIADINNDGLVDVVSLDMLPENLETYKASGLEFPYPTYTNYLKNGYAPQFMQNTLQLNLGNNTFSEIGNLSGISASEWSWGALVADYDNDGLKDIFIANGIKGATNDMDFVRFISNDEIQKGIDQGMSEDDLELIKKIPEKKTSNFFFKNNGDLTFKDITSEWTNSEKSFSNGCVYADLDNDGDLDIVVNNVNEYPFLLENKTDTLKNYINIQFKGPKENILGIGSKVKIYSEGKMQFAENYSSRGYLSAVPSRLHFGLNTATKVDSLIVNWSTGKQQKLVNVKPNHSIILDIKNAHDHLRQIDSSTNFIFKKTEDLIDFKHKDQTSLEFNYNPLIPYASTNEGPSITVTDVNNDKKDDLLVGGAKAQASSLFIQKDDGTFEQIQSGTFQEDAINEDTSQVFFDANGDEWVDLLIVSGGNEFINGKALKPRIYLNNKGVFEKDITQFQNIEINASKAVAVDFDKDGDMDIAISSDLVPREFGQTPKQYLFINKGNGVFEDVTNTIAPEFSWLGNVKDMVWKDIDNNGFLDLIAVGHWMPISIFLNDGKKLKLQSNKSLENTNGLWNSAQVHDFDKDGDLDIVAGNFGENSKLKASQEYPLTLYRNDFDNNESTETLITYFYKGQETTLASKDELVQQLPQLNKEFLSYNKFAKASLDDLFTSKKLKEAEKKYCYTLSSTYYENDGNGNFTPKILPKLAQLSTVNDVAISDFNKDGYNDLFFVGNNLEISTQLGRMDASHGLLLQNDRNGYFNTNIPQNPIVNGPARNIQQIVVNGEEHFVVTINNGKPIFLKKVTNTNND
ncbi:VCBS repeat-containing protein [Spongiivirga citrea]|uniref:ASPIC/UnbV domain-containing protein n=1 Tax=Spongiivirga citrea TaxID=1481457 RepID=A0A6M0CLP3_9FLAO|nr:VCBS repeat-containing protein [Spongiivirga citrea]NER16924.1 hypothetical protein [Spongiivirga citrea]